MTIGSICCLQNCTSANWFVASQFDVIKLIQIWKEMEMILWIHLRFVQFADVIDRKYS